MGAITVDGTVLEVEHKAGTFTMDSGESRPYDFHVAHVLCGRKVVEVRFNPDNGDAQPPAEGASIRVEVELPTKTRVIAKKYAAAAEGVRRAS